VSVANQRFLVTGGASGIGHATCLELAKLGAEGVAADVRTPESTAWPSARLDVADPADWKRVLAEHWPIHGLINCAGVRTIRPFLKLELEEFDRVMSVNVRGPFIGSQLAAARWVQEDRAGNIVNVSSLNGLAAMAQQAHYGASKAALINLTKSMAVELAPHRIRVNAVVPGSTDTALAQERIGTPEQRAAMEANIPLARVAQPGEIAQVIVFLLSNSSSYMTGTTVVADGGWSAQL
jgi:NAD(P)-dependent dehydrogenase (short-subunit alcohol dehydrogenase family)